MQIPHRTLLGLALFAAFTALVYGIGGYRAVALTILGYILGYYVAVWTEAVVRWLVNRRTP
jgi:hypothetical protein